MALSCIASFVAWRMQKCPPKPRFFDVFCVCKFARRTTELRARIALTLECGVSIFIKPHANPKRLCFLHALHWEPQSHIHFLALLQ